MPHRTEVKSVILRHHNVLMANTDSNPVRVALFDPKVESFVIRTLFQARLHDGELVPGVVLRFYVVIRDKLDVGVLEGGGELEFGGFFPNISAIY